MERTHPAPGRPLLAGPARPWAATLLVGCAVLVAVLGVLFAHQTTADRLDQAVDTPVVGWLGGHPSLAVWLAFPGSLIPAVAFSAAIIGACLLAGRRNGAVLAAVAVPAAAGLTDGLFKHLVDRTYLGVLSYPSGHTASVFALVATVAVLLLPAPQLTATETLRPLRGLLTGLACGVGIVVAIGVMGLRWHYFTDTVADAAVGIGTVCGLAFLLDLPLARRSLGRVRLRAPTAQPKARV